MLCLRSRRAILSLVPILPAFAREPDDAIWREYLTWLEGKAVGSLLGFEHYRESLARRGFREPEISRRMVIIEARALRRTEAMRLWFNSMFGEEGPEGPDWPTPLLVETVAGLEPGSALDVSMGEGRNSIFLAGLGWEVTGFDVSDTGIANALKKAERAGVKFDAVRAGYQEFDFGRHRYNLIVMAHAYFPIHDPAHVGRLLASLKPGGLLVFRYGYLDEKPAPDSAAALLGIPGKGELREIFRALDILLYEEVEELEDFHSGPGRRKNRSARFVARKK